MKKRILDSAVLMKYWKQRRSTPLTEDTKEDAAAWARDLIRIHDTNAIVTPVYVEMMCGVMSEHEFKLTQAFLGEFVCVDKREISKEDWEETIRLAQRVPEGPKLRRAKKAPVRPRKLGDCLIEAIARRLRHDVQTPDRDFIR